MATSRPLSPSAVTNSRSDRNESRALAWYQHVWFRTCSFRAWESVSSSRNDVVNMCPAFPHPQLVHADPFLPWGQTDRIIRTRAALENRMEKETEPSPEIVPWNKTFESVNNIGLVAIAIHGDMVWVKQVLRTGLARCFCKQSSANWPFMETRQWEVKPYSIIWPGKLSL